MAESKAKTSGNAEINVENIGGIREANVVFEPGITILTGQNATNRTSLLRAMNAVLGGTKGTIHARAEKQQEEATVNLGFGGEEYTYSSDGDSNTFTDDEKIVDYYSTLFELNEIRSEVRNWKEGTTKKESPARLRDYLMEPIDTEAIQNEIQRYQEEKSRLEDEIEEIEYIIKQIPKLEEVKVEEKENISELEDEIEVIENELDSLQEEIKEAPQVDDLVSERESLTSQLEDERNHFESEKRRLSKEIERAETRISKAESKIEDLESELESKKEQTSSRTTTVRDISDEIVDIEEDIERIENIRDDLRSIIKVSSKFSDNTPSEFENRSDVDDSHDLETETIECWTCGNTVKKSEVTDRTEQLRKITEEYGEEKSKLEQKLQKLEEDKKSILDNKNRISEIKTELEQLKDRIEDDEEHVESTNEEIEELEEKFEQTKEDIQKEIAKVDEKIDSIEGFEDNSIKEVSDRLSNKRTQLHSAKEELKDAESELEEAKSKQEELDGLENELESVSEQLVELRNRVDTIENEVVESVNTHMDNMVKMLEYENIARIKINKKEEQSTLFDLEITREDEDGVYTGSLDTLSESERELVGIVLGLSGYLAHRINDDVPFLLLDSLESFDAKRIDKLLDYFNEHVPYVIVALLPEDSQEVNGEANFIKADEF